MKNTLVSIGWPGERRCYLNVPKDEAIKRYATSQQILTIEEIVQLSEEPYSSFIIDEFSFDDEFVAHSAYEEWE